MLSPSTTRHCHQSCVAQMIFSCRLLFVRCSCFFSLCFCVSVVKSSYLSFSVVSANRANISEAIQKRTIILDSDQPSNSK